RSCSITADVEIPEGGANGVVISRSRDKLTAALKEIEAAVPRGTKPLLRASELDIRDFSAVRERFRTLIQDYGTPDYLINCAGFARPGYLDELEVEQIREMIDLNYMGTVHVCKAALPYMVKRGSGHFVTTSSIAGFIGLFGYTGYCGSKFAVIGFSEALRREIAPYGLRVSILCPPNTRTPGLESENRYKPKEVLATEEKVKVVDPDYVADELLRGLAKEKFMIIPTFDGALAHRLNRFLPYVLEQFVKRSKNI
ncbi:MAG: SDR family NAD(P)-dependent oxidoreductase, partial [Bdellovibrionia bacterium]